MGSRKLVRDIFFLCNQRLSAQLQARQVANTRLRLGSTDGILGSRRYSIFNEFSEKVKGAANSNPDFQQSIKDLKEKAGELKGVKEDLKVRTKQTTEQLYKRVDGVWTDAEATAKKVSANVKEKLSSATEEVKETLGLGKQERSQSSSHKTCSGADVKDGWDATYGENKPNSSESSDRVGSRFGRFKSTVSSASPKVFSIFQSLKDAKVIDLAKKGYDVVKDDLSSNPSKRRHMEQESSSFTGERSTKTDIVFVPTKQSRWEKKWEAFKNKIQDHPVFKRITKVSEPVVTKSHELAGDIRDRWETSDHPVVHKIQDLNETVFGETHTALSLKEIRQRDPSFSLPEFVAEVQETIWPTLNAYLKGDVATLKKNCTPTLIERCKAENRAYKSNGIFFDNKILHVSDLEIKETKLMESSPVIVLAFTTQQVYCVRDSQGSITEGGKDTIHTVLYYWAMKQVDVEELGEGALYPVWRLNEMQQVGAFQALI